jgi:hypothetical protein
MCLSLLEHHRDLGRIGDVGPYGTSVFKPIAGSQGFRRCGAVAIVNYHPGALSRERVHDACSQAACAASDEDNLFCYLHDFLHLG